jgi:hypothetical protein
MRKPRSDSRLAALPENQKEVLERWIYEENLSYAEVSKRLHADFGVQSSPTAVRYHKEHLDQERILARVAINAQKANEIADAFQKNPAPVPQAVVKLVTQLAFEEITRGTELDKEFIVKLTKLAVDSGLKAKKLELDERKVALLEQKAKQAEEAEKALTNTELTEEQKREKLFNIFGIPTKS